MKVIVKKGCKGFIFNRLVREGAELEIEESQFSSNWMVKVEEPKPQYKRKAKAKKQSD